MPLVSLFSLRSPCRSPLHHCNRSLSRGDSSLDQDEGYRLGRAYRRLHEHATVKSGLKVSGSLCAKTRVRCQHLASLSPYFMANPGVSVARVGVTVARVAHTVLW